MSDLLHVIRDSTGAERSRVFFDYLFRVSKDKGIPFSGTFELTPRCTLNCPMCYVHLREDQMLEKELTTGQWINLIDQAAEAGMMHARITGGECFLHPGFREIFQALEDRGVFIKILTNATLLDEEMISWIARHPIEMVQVSVYGFSPKTYKATTGNAYAFRMVDRALDMLGESGVRFEISITVSKVLAPYVEDIYHYCQKKKPLAIRLSPNPFPARPETGKKAEDYRMNLKESVAYYRKYNELTGRSALHCGAESGEEPGEDCQYPESACTLPDEGVLCAAGRALFCLTWDGKLLPCGAMSFFSANPLQVGFQSAWESIREAASKYRYPEECIRCRVRHRCAACPSVHFTEAQNLALCEETKELIREGLL